MYCSENNEGCYSTLRYYYYYYYYSAIVNSSIMCLAPANFSIINKV